MTIGFSQKKRKLVRCEALLACLITSGCLLANAARHVGRRELVKQNVMHGWAGMIQWTSARQICIQGRLQHEHALQYQAK